MLLAVALVLRMAVLLLLVLLVLLVQTPVVVERPSLLIPPGLKQKAMDGKKASFRIELMMILNTICSVMAICTTHTHAEGGVDWLASAGFVLV